MGLVPPSALHEPGVRFVRVTEALASVPHLCWIIPARSRHAVYENRGIPQKSRSRRHQIASGI